MQRGLMCGGEEIQDAALLLLQRRYHRHHALDKARTRLALRAKAHFAPLHTRTDCPLCRIVGRLDPFHLYERPQGLATLEHLAACPFGLGHPTLATRFEEALDLAAQWCHVRAKRRAFQGAVAHPMPPGKHLMRLLQQGIANRLGGSTPASNRFEVSKYMRPAQLTPPYRIPVVGTIAVRHQDAGKGLAQQLIPDSTYVLEFK